MSILEKIKSPKDLKSLDIKEIDDLALEIREKLIETVSKNGGHLAPNLGVVELTIALHKIFDTPTDKFVWDVGHQGYVHKILTGRANFFKTVREKDGCIGFLSKKESEYDAFGAGHAGTAISAAVGMAAARDLKGTNEKVVAIVGDGSLNCGLSLEGLNNVSEATKDIIIILNDNKMSISGNVGAIPKYLNKIIADSCYNTFKNFIKNNLDKFPSGKFIHSKITKFIEAVKSIILPGAFFEEMGLRYFGPVDGHNISDLLQTFENIKHLNEPCLIHVLTEKGKGYKHAENCPEKFHGLSSFDPKTGDLINTSKQETFSSAFGKSIVQLADKNDDIVAICAAMAKGTGLSDFAKKYEKRFFDVGIAEEHALVFAAGLAAQNITPIVAIYATFIQRSLDNIFHDICLQNLPVIICADRAGIVDDGPTHHGIHDVSFLRNMPNLAILQPKDETELKNMLFTAYNKKVPTIIRYPKGSSGNNFNEEDSPIEIDWGKAEVIQQGKQVAICAVGNEVKTAIEVGELLKLKGINPTIINIRFLKPFDNEILLHTSQTMPIITIEDCQVQGGLGSIVDELLINTKHKGVLHFGWGTDIVPHGSTNEIKKEYKLTSDSIAKEIKKILL